MLHILEIHSVIINVLHLVVSQDEAEAFKANTIHISYSSTCISFNASN